MSEPAAPSANLAADLELQIGNHNLAVTLPVPTGATTLRGVLPALRVLMTGLTSVAVETAAEQGRYVSCRAGCGACCRQLVPIAGAEAYHLAVLIAAMPARRQDAVLARFSAARARLEAAGLWDKLANLGRITDPKAIAALGLGYFAEHIACPFLEAESCSIHAERPLACREYLVSSDPEHCTDPAAELVEPVKLDRRLATAVARTGTGGTPHYVALTVLLEWVADNPEPPPRQAAAEILGEVLTHLIGTEISAAAPTP